MPTGVLVSDLLPRSELHVAAAELMLNRPRWLTVTMIADETKLSRHWLVSFDAGRIENPAAARLEILCAYLRAVPMRKLADV